MISSNPSHFINVVNFKLIKQHSWNSEKNIETVAKDKKANVSIYRTTVMVKIILEKQNKIIKSKTFSSSFNYNNLSNKFELFQYQKSIEHNLIDKISEEIIIYLNT